MFQENKFKIEIIEGLPDGATISVYRVGPMVDLCTGPHLPRSGVVKAVQVSKMAGSNWRGDTAREALQRVYSISFPDKDLLKEHNHRMEEAKKRDHRNIGTQQDLFFFHALSPGSCFFTEQGTRIFNALVDLMRVKYWEYDYTEVTSPNIYNMDLWEISGHKEHYKQNMFCFPVERQEFGLKPMNCPGHCLMFQNRTRSYRELPLRFAEFGVLHRNEYSGALHGLTRVRRFQQDDAHIFCRYDQIEQEMKSCVQLLEDIYGILGLEYECVLSTRPDKFLGEPSLWDDAEASLQKALDSMGQNYRIDPGEGAFYGPKIDISVKDALKRKF